MELCTKASNHPRTTPKGPKIALGNPDRPLLICRSSPTGATSGSQLTGWAVTQ